MSSGRHRLGRPARLAAALAALAALALVPALAGAQGPTALPLASPGSLGGAGSGVEAAAEVPPEAVSAIAADLNCPLCQGYTLADCPLTVCAQMRDLIRRQLAEGRSREEIVAGFVADYGPQVLNAPPTTGVFLTAWLLPALALLAGAAGLAWLLRRGRRPLAAASPAAGAVAAAGPGPEAVDPAYAARLERLVSGEEEG